ncbi:MAG TPA: hypothetical protein VJO32_08110 [Ktedonobacteraceae bacterium]|nr:hypothetical protein [Ktedonobacteraceae bacterium]
MHEVNETTQPDAGTASTQTTHKNHLRAHLLSRLAALCGVLVAGLLYLFLPDKLIIGPSWLLLVIEAALSLPILVSLTTERKLPHGVTRGIALVLLGVVTLALAIGIALLINNLHGENGIFLLRSAAILWVFNILVFALWYFEIDGGGPLKRHLADPQATDFLFPQYAPGANSNWKPQFLDYVFLAFTSSTALSPADTQPLTKKAKVLMMIQAVFSLVVIALLAGRAVNILQ